VGDLALDGRDLIRLGLKPGPRFRRILEGLLDQVLGDPALNRTEALEVEALRLADMVDEGKQDA
jgi:tRNA nucleotidyltransferase (CCA-adding enzyme)